MAGSDYTEFVSGSALGESLDKKLEKVIALFLRCDRKPRTELVRIQRCYNYGDYESGDNKNIFVIRGLYANGRWTFTLRLKVIKGQIHYHWLEYSTGWVPSHEKTKVSWTPISEHVRIPMAN